MEGRPRNHSRETGSSLIAAVAVMVILGGIAATLSTMYVSGVDTTGEHITGLRTFNLATSALQMAQKNLFDNNCQVAGLPNHNSEISALDGAFRFQVAEDPEAGAGHFIITATGYSPNQASASNWRQVAEKVACTAEGAGDNPFSNSTGNLFNGQNSPLNWNHPDNISGNAFVYDNTVSGDTSLSAAGKKLTFDPIDEGDHAILGFNYTAVGDVALEVAIKLKTGSPNYPINVTATPSTPLALASGSGRLCLDFGPLDLTALSYIQIDIRDINAPETMTITAPTLAGGTEEECVNNDPPGITPVAGWRENLG